MRQREEELSAEARRELEALDRALAGEDTAPGLEGLQTLVRELRAGRPQPSPGFAAKLDELAADGFQGTGRRMKAERLRAWLAGIRPIRVLAPAGAFATLAMVVSVAVIRSGGGDDGDPGAGATPETPTLTRPATGGAAGAPSGEAGGGGRGEAQLHGLDAPQTADSPDVAPIPPGPPVGAARDRLAPGQRERAIESSASLGLSADADEFDQVADGVVAVTDRYDGLVVGSDETASGAISRASFELAIPSDRLQDALAELSVLAHVESRTEATEDITAPTVSARARLTDAQTEADALLRQLAEAETPAETREIRARLDVARVQVAEARDDARRLSRRAELATVLVTVTSDGAGDGDWGVEEALDDVGDVLSTAAGVTLVSLAILLPVALVVALVALAYRLTVRRGRERTLDSGG